MLFWTLDGGSLGAAFFLQNSHAVDYFVAQMNSTTMQRNSQH